MDKTQCGGCGKVHPAARIYPSTGGGFPSRPVSSVEDGIRLLDEGVSVGCITPKQRVILFRQLVALGQNGLPLSEKEAVEEHADTLMKAVQEILDSRESPGDSVGSKIKAALEAASSGGVMVVRVRGGELHF